MPMTFPTHPAAVVGLKLWRPRWFDGVALVLGAMAPDLAYALDGSGLPVWPFSHQLRGLVGWSLPVAVVGTWIVRRAAPAVATHLAAAGPLALRDFGAIRVARHRWWVTAYSALLGAASHLLLDRLEARFSPLQVTLDAVGVVLIVMVVRYVGRRRLLRSWYGDPPAPPGRPALFWSVAGTVAVPAAAAVPFLPAAHLPHTTGVRLLCAVAAGLIAASVVVSVALPVRNRPYRT